jgi:hypothetical protein
MKHAFMKSAVTLSAAFLILSCGSTGPAGGLILTPVENIDLYPFKDRGAHPRRKKTMGPLGPCDGHHSRNERQQGL